MTTTSDCQDVPASGRSHKAARSVLAQIWLGRGPATSSRSRLVRSRRPLTWPTTQHCPDTSSRLWIPKASRPGREPARQLGISSRTPVPSRVGPWTLPMMKNPRS